MRDNVFSEMGHAIHNEWQRSGFNDLVFPKIAGGALRNMQLHNKLNTEQLARLVLDLNSDLPWQYDIEASFGQPPVTLFTTETFRIEALFWTTGLPGIHQHAFSGAFHVLAGTSLHVVWNFVSSRRIRAGLLAGFMECMSAEVLQIGDVQAITAGNEFIHATYHLDSPSITIVVRTHREDDKCPQLGYWPPTVALDRMSLPFTLRRRLQLLRTLAQTDYSSLVEETLDECIDAADEFTAIVMLLEAMPLVADVKRVKLAANLKRERPSVASIVLPAVDETLRRNKVMKVLGRVRTDDLKFFLAMVLNLGSSAHLWPLLATRWSSREGAIKIMDLIMKADALGGGSLDREGRWIQIVFPYILNLCERRDLPALHSAAANVVTGHWLLGSLANETVSSAVQVSPIES